MPVCTIRCGAILAAALICLCVPAQAEEHRPEPPPSGFLPDGRSVADEADAHLKRGVELFAAMKFLEAAPELEQAHSMKPDPILLFNIGQAYRRGGESEKALLFYRKFLTEVPDTPLLAETRGYIADMEALLEASERQRQVQRALSSEKQRTEQTKRELVVATQRADRAEQEKRRPIYRKAWFWGVLGSSVVAIGAAVGLAVAFTRDPQTDGGFVNIDF